MSQPMPFDGGEDPVIRCRAWLRRPHTHPCHTCPLKTKMREQNLAKCRACSM